MLGIRTDPDRRLSVRLAGGVTKDEPAAALTAGIHHRAFGRGSQLLEHLDVEALVLRTELGIAQATLDGAPGAALTIRFHAVESTEGTTTLRVVPLGGRRPGVASVRTSRSASVSRSLLPSSGQGTRPFLAGMLASSSRPFSAL